VGNEENKFNEKIIMNKEQNKKEFEKIKESIYDSIKMYFGLMTTIIVLSSGVFYALFQLEKTRSLSFLYFIPIATALLCLFNFYSWNLKRKLYKYCMKKSISTNNPEIGEDEYVKAMEYLEMAKISGKLSKIFFRFTLLFFTMISITILLMLNYPLIYLPTNIIVTIVIVSILLCLIYLFIKWAKLKRNLKRTNWFE